LLIEPPDQGETMFDSIRKHQRLLQFLLLILILPAFMFFGISGYDGMLSGNRGVATVAGRDITQQEFDEAQRQQIEQLRQMLGSSIDTKMFDTPESRKEVLEGLISQRVIADEAAARKVAVTDERVRQTILGIPGLKRDDGSFDDARYKALLSGQNMTPAGFEMRLRSDLALQILPDAVQSSAIVPKTVRDQLIALQEQSREIRELRFAAADFAASVKPTDEQLTAYYEANARSYETPEVAKVEYVVLDRASLAKQVSVGADDLKTYYEQNRARFGTAEERRASHILLKTGPEAKAKAESLLEKLKADPTQFEALARANSDDPGSAVQGGDLGFFAQGMMVKAFADAAFSMKDGEIRGPVETEFGQHIIRVTGIKPGDLKPFEAVRAEIEKEVQSQQASSKYAESAEAFTNTVYEQSDSLKPVADKFGLQILTADGVGRQPAQGAAPGTALANPRLLASLFTDDVLRNKRNTEAIEIAPGQLASARIVEYRAPKRRPLEEVRDLVRTQVVEQEAARLAKQAGEAKLSELKAGKGDATSFTASRVVSRGAPGGLSQPALESVFRLPAESTPVFGGIDLGTQGYSLVQLLKVTAPSAEVIAQRQATYDQQLGRVIAQQDVVDYIESLKQRAKIVRHLDRLGAQPESSRP
jgi:peptidyl-prolyl cis-trans isomerase D